MSAKKSNQQTTYHMPQQCKEAIGVQVQSSSLWILYRQGSYTTLVAMYFSMGVVVAIQAIEGDDALRSFSNGKGAGRLPRRTRHPRHEIVRVRYLTTNTRNFVLSGPNFHPLRCGSHEHKYCSIISTKKSVTEIESRFAIVGSYGCFLSFRDRTMAPTLV